MTPSPWLAIQAIWTRGVVELDGLRFVPGDILHEYFSPLHPYNVFAVCSPAGELRGWYANVTYPTRLDLSSEPPTVTWHDLYLDVVALPNGQFVIRDEDELHEAGVDQRDPDLYAMIVAAGEAIVDRLRKHLFPFVDHEFSPSLPGFGER
jgi:predicted RNA-binding protein associated with RNAse of E/G family